MTDEVGAKNIRHLTSFSWPVFLEYRNYISHTAQKMKFSIEDFLSKSQQTQTSLRRLQDVLKRSRRLTTKPDVVKTSGRGRFVYDVLKTSDLRLLEDIWFAVSWGRLFYDILKTSDLRRPEDVYRTTSV